MYDNRATSVFRESAFTLQHKRTFTYSFSRATRFRSLKRSEGAEFVALPSTLNRRGTSQGYGERWSPGNTLGAKSPAPGSYNVPSSFNLKSGPKYSKDSPLRGKETIEITPGPGSYENAHPFGKFAPKFTFRPKIIHSKTNDSPPPDAYSPNFITNAAFKNITFGIGERIFLRNIKGDSPGPGSYEVKSVFKKRAGDKL